VLETIACHLELFRRVDILHCALEARPIGALANPQKKIVFLPLLKV